MGKVTRAAKTRVDARSELWRVALSYLQLREQRDAAAKEMEEAKEIAFRLLDKLGRNLIDYPHDGGKLRVQRIERSMPRWDVVGLKRALERKVAPEQVASVFKLTVDENALTALLDQGLVELADIEPFATPRVSQTFRVDVIKGSSPDEAEEE